MRPFEDEEPDLSLSVMRSDVTPDEDDGNFLSVKIYVVLWNIISCNILYKTSPTQVDQYASACHSAP